MEQADYVHLVRISELASAQNSQAYRRSVVWFAALGYAWVLGCLGLAVGLLWWAGWQLLAGQRHPGWFMMIVGGLSLLWSSARALWLKVDPAQGIALQPEDAPALFELLERIRRKTAGPRLDAVYLTDDFNAGICQVPRWGGLGRPRNELSLGLPLLMAFNQKRLLAILAHEWGHLRGGHGQFGAWVYRTRLSWSRLYASLEDEASVVSYATHKFLHWYFPRFLAKTFAMARQDEYEADRMAARLLGPAVVADALVESEVRAQWLADKFWQQHWRLARTHAVPVGPYRAMKRGLAQPVAPVFAQQALKDCLARDSDLEDTHPALKDRVDALTQQPAQLPQQWSDGSALALLDARQLDEWLKIFDQQWCQANASTWKAHHARLARCETQLAQLASAGDASIDDLLQRAQLMRRLDPRAPVTALYQAVLRRQPNNAKALAGLVGVLPQGMGDVQLQMLERLFEQHVDYRWWAIHYALQLLQSGPPLGAGKEKAQALQLWRERLKQTSALEDRFTEELMQTPLLQALQPHGVTAFELSEVQAELRNFRPVARAWLVRKHLGSMPSRPVFLLLVDIDRLNEEEGDALEEQIDDSLNLPGKLCVIRLQQAETREELQRQGFAPVYSRTL